MSKRPSEKDGMEAGGGGFSEPEQHPPPAQCPAVASDFAIAPEHPNPAWPTPKYHSGLAKNLAGQIKDLQQDPETMRRVLSEVLRGDAVEDAIPTVPMPRDSRQERYREIRARNKTGEEEKEQDVFDFFDEVEKEEPGLIQRIFNRLRGT